MDKPGTYERAQITFAIIEEIDLISTSGFSGEVIPLPREIKEENEL